MSARAGVLCVALADLQPTAILRTPHRSAKAPRRLSKPPGALSPARRAVRLGSKPRSSGTEARVRNSMTTRSPIGPPRRSGGRNVSTSIPSLPSCMMRLSARPSRRRDIRRTTLPRLSTQTRRTGAQQVAGEQRCREHGLSCIISSNNPIQRRL